MRAPFARLNPHLRQTPHFDVPSHQNLNDKLNCALQGHRGTAGAGNGAAQHAEMISSI
ncbi:hypothetical protein AB4Y44_19480 [Paraburkholderia sp. BR10937]|uniref:hypothetical protein n=1 Tax=Paraburkholderia sp. BR10937 TaxID=3236994 RepID=UPI0034D1C889